MWLTDDQVLELICKIICGKNPMLLTAIDNRIAQLARYHETDTYTIDNKSCSIEDVMLALMQGKEVVIWDTIPLKFDITKGTLTSDFEIKSGKENFYPAFKLNIKDDLCKLLSRFHETYTLLNKPIDLQ